MSAASGSIRAEDLKEVETEYVTIPILMPVGSKLRLLCDMCLSAKLIIGDVIEDDIVPTEEIMVQGGKKFKLVFLEEETITVVAGMKIMLVYDIEKYPRGKYPGVTMCMM
jgi:hypothetical protein